MKKGFAVLLVLCLNFYGSAVAQAVPEVTAGAAVLMDAESGQVYFAKNAEKRHYPASLTKVMTAVVGLESGNLEETVTVNKTESEGTVIDLQTGDKLTLEELLKAALVCSANDATVAIAEHVGGIYDNFIHMMNVKAKALGAFNSHYTNTNGLHDPGHYCTAYDMALISRYALHNPQFAGLVQTRETTIKWRHPERKLTVLNSNRLLFSAYPGINGVKTGTTAMAGNCLIASATRNGKQLIAVVLSSADRYYDARVLLDYGFEEIRPVIILSAGEPVTTMAIQEGETFTVGVTVKNDLELYLSEKDIACLERKIYLPKVIRAPVQKGETLGYVAYYLGGQELGRSDLVAGRQVRRAAWYRRIWIN
ncbi:MAG: D-alanyl-D-alanine carboxypeptidase [Peptococcaceae bacterium]|nr:MAG: D-alanyl-D-alanine carboxypeptidase [Peptococcaceae bacterium]